MKKYLSLSFLFSTILLLTFLSGSGQILTPVKWRTSSEPVAGKPGQYKLIFDATIDPTWHVYSMQSFGDDGPTPTAINFDDSSQIKFIGKGIETSAHTDEGFDKMWGMKVKQFSESVRFAQIICVVDDKTPIKGSVSFQACANVCVMGIPIPFNFQLAKGDCGAPSKVTLVVPLDTLNKNKPDTSHTKTGLDTAANHTSIIPSNVTPASAANTVCLNKNLVLDSVDLNKPVLDCVKKEVEKNSSLWTIFLLGLAGGLLSLLTPCVFPMIPLTVSFFIKGSNERRKGIVNAVLYSFFIFLIYVLLSVPFHIFDSLDSGVLSAISTGMVLNTLFFIIFVAFAISFFGYYEIGLPSGLGNKVDSASDVGGILGIFLMALTLAIVSFSCTGPILGSLLGLTAQNGAWALTAGMAGFGFALALPFGLFAAFPSWLNSLPKSGGWLTTVKASIGFIELAFALKFLSNADLVAHWGILKREIFFGIWIVIGFVFSLYLFGFIKFPHDNTKKINKWRKGGGVIVLLFTLYLVPGLTHTKYANVSLVSGFPPPMYYSLYEHKTECPLDLDCHKNDFCSAMAQAKKENKPLFIDFTGYACVNCRQNEEHVWPEPAIFEKLSKEYVVVSLYVDDRKALSKEDQITITEPTGGMRDLRTEAERWTYFQRRNFNNNSQPYYVLLSPDGKLLTNPKAGLISKPADFLAFLECGLKAHKQLQGK